MNFSDTSGQSPSRNEKDVLYFERSAYKQGYQCIAGLDEAGRGPLAGPVVAAAVVLYNDQYLAGVDDSKRLTEAKRTSLFHVIRSKALATGIGFAGNSEIDSINVLEATRLAMIRSLKNLPVNPDCLLLDALTLPGLALHQVPIVSGDRLSHSIAAASILAKVVRDRIMAYWHKRFPHYNWIKNKGYGTAEHLAAISRHGTTPLHRQTFRGVKQYPELFDNSAKLPD